MKKIDRLQFLQLAGGVLGAGVATAAAACGGDDAAGPSCSATNPQTNISANHGHAMSVSGADVTAAITKTYDIKGLADHSHTVQVLDSNFRELAAGSKVTAFSTSGGVNNHTH